MVLMELGLQVFLPEGLGLISGTGQELIKGSGAERPRRAPGGGGEGKNSGPALSKALQPLAGHSIFWTSQALGKYSQRPLPAADNERSLFWSWYSSRGETCSLVQKDRESS